MKEGGEEVKILSRELDKIHDKKRDYGPKHSNSPPAGYSARVAVL